MNKDGGSYVCVYLQSFTILSLCTVLLISQAHININLYAGVYCNFSYNSFKKNLENRLHEKQNDGRVIAEPIV